MIISFFGWSDGSSLLAHILTPVSQRLFRFDLVLGIHLEVFYLYHLAITLLAGLWTICNIKDQTWVWCAKKLLWRLYSLSAAPFWLLFGIFVHCYKTCPCQYQSVKNNIIIEHNLTILILTRSTIWILIIFYDIGEIMLKHLPRSIQL